MADHNDPYQAERVYFDREFIDRLGDIDDAGHAPTGLHVVGSVLAHRHDYFGDQAAIDWQLHDGVERYVHLHFRLTPNSPIEARSTLERIRDSLDELLDAIDDLDLSPGVPLEQQEADRSAHYGDLMNNMLPGFGGGNFLDTIEDLEEGGD